MIGSLKHFDFELKRILKIPKSYSQHQLPGNTFVETKTQTKQNINHKTRYSKISTPTTYLTSQSETKKWLFPSIPFEIFYNISSLFFINKVQKILNRISSLTKQNFLFKYRKSNMCLKITLMLIKNIYINVCFRKTKLFFPLYSIIKNDFNLFLYLQTNYLNIEKIFSNSISRCKYTISKLLRNFRPLVRNLKLDTIPTHNDWVA